MTYAMIWGYGHNIFNNVRLRMQLERGVATPYEPFVPDSPSPDYPSPISFIPQNFNLYVKKSEQIMQTIPINLTAPLYSLPDGVSDKVDLNSLETHNIGVKVFDGTENIKEHGTLAGWFYYTLSGGNADGNAIPQSTHFEGAVYGGRSLPDKSVCMGGPTPDRIVFRYLTYSGAELSFKAFLASQHAAGTPVMVLYQLAEPIITEFTALSPKTFYPYTQFYTTGSDIKPELDVTVRVIGNGDS